MSDKELKKKFEREIIDGHYLQASFYLEILTERYPNNIEYKYALISCYTNTNQAKKALMHLAALEKSGSRLTEHFYLYKASALFLIEDFKASRDVLNIIASNVSDELKSDFSLLDMKLKAVQKESDSEHKTVIRNLGEKINSEANDHSVIISNDHQTIYYTVQSKDENSGYQENIYTTSQNEHGQWNTPELMKGLKSDGNSATVQMQHNDTDLILYNDGDLYRRRFYKNEWRSPLPLKEINTPAHETHCFITEDGNRIFYASRLNGGENNDLDLFYIEKDENNEWSEPISLALLNTELDEDAPFVTKDGTIYFSSKGHNSFGGFDIFKATYNKKEDTWNKPVNLGFPINSVADDIYFNYFGHMAYFSSNRVGGFGLLDLYHCFFFKRVKIQGEVTDKYQKNIADAVIRIQGDGKVFETRTDHNGKYEAVVPIDTGFTFTIEKNNKIIYQELCSVELSFTTVKDEETNFHAVNINDKLHSRNIERIAVRLFNSEYEKSSLIVGEEGVIEDHQESELISMQSDELLVEVYHKNKLQSDAKILIDGKTLEADKEGRFIFHKGEGMMLPGVVASDDKSLDVKTWSIYNNVMRIQLESKSDFRLSGTVLIDGVKPYIYQKVEAISADGNRHHMTTNGFGVFDTIIDANHNQETYWEIGVPGKELQSFTLKQDRLHSDFKISVSEEKQKYAVNLALIDEGGQAISDVFTLFDGEYFLSSSKGNIKVEKPLKGSFYASTEMIDVSGYTIKNVDYEEILDRLIITVEKQEEQLAQQTIEVSTPDTVFIERDYLDGQLYKSVFDVSKLEQENQDVLDVEKDIFKLWANLKVASLDSEATIEEYKGELSTLNEELVHIKNRNDKNNESLNHMISSLRRIVEVMENKLHDKEAEVESARRKGYTYLLSFLVMFSAFMTMSILWKRVRKQKSSLQEMNARLDMAYGEVKYQKKQIIDSLEYAQTLQNSILPMAKDLRQSFQEYFVYYQPRDIVSGDFYWYQKVEVKDKEYTFLAAVDCTGHGVPGAFMSMMGYAYLQEVLDKKLSYEPNEILKLLDQKVRSGLKQRESNNSDGMDMVLIRIEEKEGEQFEVKYAGAKSDLYVYNSEKNVLERLKGERKGVGGHVQTTKEFTSSTLDLKKGDSIFLLTDGVLDQNNANGKKYGRKRFENFLEMNSDKLMSEIHEELEKEMKDFMKTEKQRDDMTVIGLKLA
ncbi:SpoIIE family protein phosphatase [Sediminitomix flava]|uniref:SpoIIE family protein phosphatase n=1 Tax=Sediminitomix flava TaxID=379075 RepID=UPI001304D77F|nr:SpoIIE family protein phosphatase [Sediminitomix flava]